MSSFGIVRIAVVVNETARNWGRALHIGRPERPQTVSEFPSSQLDFLLKQARILDFPGLRFSIELRMSYQLTLVLRNYGCCRNHLCSLDSVGRLQRQQPSHLQGLISVALGSEGQFDNTETLAFLLFVEWYPPGQVVL